MRKILFWFLCVLFLGPAAVFAQTDTASFIVTVFGDTDDIPPSTPILLSATPIAPTQIDIAWSASTDNYLVSGYSILRDGTPIATTTLLSYSDTGLTASTTYSYVVRAFDPFFNYSSTSNSLATATPDVPPPPPPATSTPPSRQEGTAARVVVDELYITSGISTTSFDLVTAHQARMELRWGRTGSYELGYVISDVFSKNHSILLTELEPGTTYEYELIGYTPAGFQTVLKRGTFTTLLASEKMLPPNVSRFTAVGNGTDVDLTWVVPTSLDVAYVRVVRSHLGFPQHPQDGAVVYQGLRGAARDTDILSQYSPVFYTAFVVDTYGSVSSGAIAIVYASGVPDDRGGTTLTPDRDRPTYDVGGNLATSTDEATSTINTNRYTIEMRMPALSDVSLFQEGRHFSFIDRDITLDPAFPFTITIPKDVVAGNLKSIIATVIDPTDNRQTYSYLLRINKDRTAYEAVIAPLSVSGQTTLLVEIYDYEAYVVGTYQTPVVLQAALIPTTEPILFPDVLFTYWPFVLFSFGGMLLLILIVLLIKRKRDEDNHS